MDYLLSTLLTLSLLSYLGTNSNATGQNKPLDMTHTSRDATAQANTGELTARGDVDLLLEKLRKRGERVVDRCLENCKTTEDMTGGDIINKPQPPYPVSARARRIPGEVSVRLLVDEKGRVVGAQAVSGHPMLRKAATKATRSWRFSPTLLSGQPVKVTGTVTVNFTLQ